MTDNSTKSPSTNRVLLVTPYYPPHSGGVERYVESLAHELRARPDWAVTVVTTAEVPDGPAVSFAIEEGIGVYRLRPTVRLSNSPVGIGWAWQLKQIIRREAPTVINAHAPVPGLADVAAAVAGSVPFVLTYHAGPMRKEHAVLDAVVRAYERLVLPLGLRRADAIITSSDFVTESLPSATRHKSTTITPGIAPEIFSPAPAGGATRATEVLFVGSLDEAARYKNVPGLLQAVRRLVDSGVDVTARIVGDGDARHRFESLAVELGIAGLVEFAGPLRGRALVEAYRRSAFFVLPTTFDSFPTVLCEAMACGKPVVATTVGGIPELVTHGMDGLLVEPGDLEGLTAAMRGLLVDAELRDRLGAAARTAVAERLSWMRKAETTVAVFAAVSDRLPERTTSGRAGDGISHVLHIAADSLRTSGRRSAQASASRIPSVTDSSARQPSSSAARVDLV